LVSSVKRKQRLTRWERVFGGEEDQEDDLETYYSDDLAGKFRMKFRSRINLLRGFLEDFE